MASVLIHMSDCGSPLPSSPDIRSVAARSSAPLPDNSPFNDGSEPWIRANHARVMGVSYILKWLGGENKGIAMNLQSQLFRGDPKLEAAAVSDPAHILPGAIGQHVAKIQQALMKLDEITIDPEEFRSTRYGPSTANAVLSYKKKRNIINQNYQKHADNIVGKLTIAAMDKELVEKGGPPDQDPLTNPMENARIQALVAKERPGVRRMIETTVQSLDEVQTAFQVFYEDPARSNNLQLKNLLTIDGLQRFFSLNLSNYKFWIPKIIEQYNEYLRQFPRLVTDQQAADFPTLVRDHDDMLESGKITAGKTPPAFSDAPTAMYFTPRYRAFDPNMPDIFKGLFSEALQGIQLHEMGHFYFSFEDGDPTGKPPQMCLRLAASYDLLARQATFKRRI
jgi:hypothetical protein